MTTYVALLRGINLGKHRKVPMAELRELLADRGYESVRTHLQSGNVVLSSAADPDEIARDIEKGITERWGFTTPVIMRTAAELAAIVELNPLGDVAANPSWSFVAFLSQEPDHRRVEELEGGDYAPDQVQVIGREAYFWLPAGLHRAKISMTSAEQMLGVTATARNWNTVTKLASLAADG